MNAPRHTSPHEPTAAGQSTNVAAVIALVAGGLSLLILPIILAPAAVIAGVIGDQQGRREGHGGRAMASWGVVLGLVGLLVMYVMSVRAGNGL